MAAVAGRPESVGAKLILHRWLLLVAAVVVAVAVGPRVYSVVDSEPKDPLPAAEAEKRLRLEQQSRQEGLRQVREPGPGLDSWIPMLDLPLDWQEDCYCCSSSFCHWHRRSSSYLGSSQDHPF